MGVYQDVLLGQATLADAVTALTQEGQRRYAYELAVCVCDSDGVRCDAENIFLKDLRSRLGLDNDKAVAAVEQQADAIALAAAAPSSLARDATLTRVPFFPWSGVTVRQSNKQCIARNDAGKRGCAIIWIATSLAASEELAGLMVLTH